MHINYSLVFNINFMGLILIHNWCKLSNNYIAIYVCLFQVIIVSINKKVAIVKLNYF